MVMRIAGSRGVLMYSDRCSLMDGSNGTGQRLQITISLVVLVLFLILIPAMSLPAVDQSVGAHFGIEIDAAGDPHMTVGADLRLVGGRGMFGTKVSMDFTTGNPRAYAADVAADSTLLISSYGLLQYSIFYGDLTVYGGPGTSLYLLTGVPDGATSTMNILRNTIATDGLVHLLAGVSYSWYPMTLFAEIEYDLGIVPLAFDIMQPHIRMGFSLQP